MTDIAIDRAAELREADNITRLAFLREYHEIPHPRLEGIEAKLQEILDSPAPWEMNRAFFARSFNGKSTASKRFTRLNLRDPNPLGDAVKCPVVRVSMPGAASTREFGIRILQAVREPFSHKWATAQIMSAAYAVLKAVGTRLLIIDEFQDVEHGSYRNRQAVKNVVKSIGEDCGCGVALFATCEGISIITGEPQLARRFEHEAIPSWRSIERETLELLLALERRLPLRKASNIAADPTVAHRIVMLGDGVIGHIRRVVLEAARVAIQTGREVIDAKTLDALEWVPLEDRCHNESFANDFAKSAAQVIGIDISALSSHWNTYWEPPVQIYNDHMGF